MRILIMSHNLIERGNYFRALKFAGFLASRGHDVTFMPSSYRWYKPKKYMVGAVRVIESPSWSFVIGKDDGWSPIGAVYRIWTALRRKYDIVYGFSHKPVDFLPAWCARIFRRSFYITDWCDWWGKGGLFENIKYFREHDTRLSRMKKMILAAYDRVEALFEEFVPRRADFVTVICRALYERARAIGVKEENLLLLVSGADTENIQPMNKAAARERIGLNKLSDDWREMALLGYTANYHMDEDFLLEAFSRVSRAHPGVRMLVVGAEFRQSEERMGEWGLKIFDATGGGRITPAHNIIHFGRRPFREMGAFLGACDILLLPMTDIVYNRGRWPHKVGDYLAAGRPIIVNDVGDIPLLIRGRDVGYIARPDAADFAEKIIQMLGEREKWEMFGVHARNLAETELNWERLGEQLYERIRKR
jgi:glycosyltransferase involved in cell wall biosynthesis